MNPYWSAFGDNIEEFGQLITATSNDENYGRIEGGGAYEEGDKVTLKAICHDDFWSENYKKYVHLFDVGTMVIQRSAMILHILIRSVKRIKCL